MYLLTHSLLSSWLYAMKDNPYETARDPLDEFKRVLNRQPTETTDAMQRGIDFENLVTAIVEGKETFGFENVRTVNNDYPWDRVPADIKDNKWYDAALQIANIVRGGCLQYKASKKVYINGTPILLYGRLDALKAGTVYDIKFSRSYDIGKFVSSTQHPMYMELIPEAYQFSYLVSNGTNVRTETYRRDETPDIIPIVADFLNWLRAADLFGVYAEHWKSK